MKVIVLLSSLILVALAGYWLVYMPESIRNKCNQLALGQMDSKLTYFRQNKDHLNDKYVFAYEKCLKDNDMEKYSLAVVGEKLIGILVSEWHRRAR